MVFKKKKKDPIVEEPTTTEHITTNIEDPVVEEKEVSVQSVQQQELVRSFTAEYDGMVSYGTDTVRANVLFGVYGELRKLNENMSALLDAVRAENNED